MAIGMGGLLAVFSLPAAALEIWQINVASARGEPLRASVSLQTAPGEQVGPECLSLGDERDAPDPELPLIRDARFTLSSTGDSIQFTTSDAINHPAVSVVLRVQCAGSPLYARVVNLHLKPPAVAQAITVTRSFPGANLKIKPGDTLYGIARTIFPQNGETVQDLVKAIVLVNPTQFPEQRSRPLRVGEELRIPDLRTVQQILKNPPPKPVARAAATVSAPVRDPHSAISTPTQPVPLTTKAEPAVVAATSKSPAIEAPSPRREKPVKGLQLKIANDVDLSRVGMDESRRAELRRIYAGESPRRVVVAAPTAANDALELKAARLRESQSLIDQQIGKLEQAVHVLSRAVFESARQTPQPPMQPAPQPAPAPRPSPPQVIVRDEMPWWLWPAVAAAALVAAVLAFLFGRRAGGGRKVDEHEARIDRLLEEARSAAGPLLSPSNASNFDPPAPREAPEKIARTPAPKAKPKPTAPAIPVVDVPKIQQDKDGEASTPLPGIDAAIFTPPPAAANVDLVLESDAPAEEETAATGVSTNLRQEMDLALDNTRSMFTDVDRFIALGRTENAISMLEFQVRKDEKDRDSWVKLLAVYRQENMTTEFEKAHRNFKRLFPGEKV